MAKKDSDLPQDHYRINAGIGAAKLAMLIVLGTLMGVVALIGVIALLAQ